MIDRVEWSINDWHLSMKGSFMMHGGVKSVAW